MEYGSDKVALNYEMQIAQLLDMAEALSRKVAHISVLSPKPNGAKTDSIQPELNRQLSNVIERYADIIDSIQN